MIYSHKNRCGSRRRKKKSRKLENKPHKLGWQTDSTMQIRTVKKRIVRSIHK